MSHVLEETIRFSFQNTYSFDSVVRKENCRMTHYLLKARNCLRLVGHRSSDIEDVSTIVMLRVTIVVDVSVQYSSLLSYLYFLYHIICRRRRSLWRRCGNRYPLDVCTPTDTIICFVASPLAVTIVSHRKGVLWFFFSFPVWSCKLTHVIHIRCLSFTFSILTFFFFLHKVRQYDYKTGISVIIIFLSDSLRSPSSRLMSLHKLLR